AEAIQLLTYFTVVVREEVAPAAIAKLGRACRRVDDVGEHHREQVAFELPPAADAREELLDLFDDRVAVADEGEGVDPLALDVAGSGDVLGQVLGGPDIPHELPRAMHDQ